MNLRELVVINKQNSINMLITYKLYISKTREDDIYSMSIETSDDISFAEDICCDRESAERFLYLLAKEEVEPCHLHDIVYDTLPLYYQS